MVFNDVAVLRLWSKSLKINCEKIYFFSKVTARITLYCVCLKSAQKLVVREKQIFWFVRKLNVRKKMGEN